MNCSASATLSIRSNCLMGAMALELGTRGA
jgi:hypothetical protein